MFHGGRSHANLKVYISSDMEGSTGIVSAEQVTFGKPEYEFGRRMQLHDTLAAVNAVLSWGAESVTVNDSHGRMINLDVSMFPVDACLISGSPKILGMVEGVSEHDAALFIGYHAMAGTEKAVLDHTYHSKVVYGLQINGIKLGETGLNALFCGALDVPVSLVVGDTAVCLEALSLLGDTLVICPLKEGLGRNSAIIKSPESTEALITESVKKALDAAASDKSPILKMEAPYKAELTFHSTVQADAAGLVPGSERISGRTMVFTTEDIFELRRWYSSSIDCAALVGY